VAGNALLRSFGWPPQVVGGVGVENGKRHGWADEWILCTVSCVCVCMFLSNRCFVLINLWALSGWLAVSLVVGGLDRPPHSSTIRVCVV